MNKKKQGSIRTAIMIPVIILGLVSVLSNMLAFQNIRKINNSLAQITEGNLNVTVDVRDNAEFASLSDDINSTVATLKKTRIPANRFCQKLRTVRRKKSGLLPFLPGGQQLLHLLQQRIFS